MGGRRGERASAVLSVRAPASASPGTVLRPGTAEDASALATLHAGQIAGGFLAALGEAFLQRLYGRIVSTPGSFVIVADVDGALGGFVAGSWALRRLYARFALLDVPRRFIAAPLAVSVALPRALETLRHGAADRAGSIGAGELLAIAVDPAHRRRGLGSALVAAFVDELRQHGVAAAEVTVGADNTDAIALYLGAGFAPVRRVEVHRGTPSVVLRRDTSAVTG